MFRFSLLLFFSSAQPGSQTICCFFVVTVRRFFRLTPHSAGKEKFFFFVCNGSFRNAKSVCVIVCEVCDCNLCVSRNLKWITKRERKSETKNWNYGNEIFCIFSSLPLSMLIEHSNILSEKCASEVKRKKFENYVLNCKTMGIDLQQSFFPISFHRRTISVVCSMATFPNLNLMKYSVNLLLWPN